MGKEFLILCLFSPSNFTFISIRLVRNLKKLIKYFHHTSDLTIPVFDQIVTKFSYSPIHDLMNATFLWNLLQSTKSSSCLILLLKMIRFCEKVQNSRSATWKQFFFVALSSGDTFYFRNSPNLNSWSLWECCSHIAWIRFDHKSGVKTKKCMIFCLFLKEILFYRAFLIFIHVEFTSS